MKNLNNQKLSLHKKLVVKLNNDLKNNLAVNDKFNGNLPTNPLEGMKPNDSTIIGDSFFCKV